MRTKPRRSARFSAMVSPSKRWPRFPMPLRSLKTATASPQTPQKSRAKSPLGWRTKRLAKRSQTSSSPTTPVCKLMPSTARPEFIPPDTPPAKMKATPLTPTTMRSCCANWPSSLPPIGVRNFVASSPLPRLAKRTKPIYSREFAAGRSAKLNPAMEGSATIPYSSPTVSPKVSPNLVPPPKTPSATGPRPWPSWPRSFKPYPLCDPLRTLRHAHSQSYNLDSRHLRPSMTAYTHTDYKLQSQQPLA